MFFKKKFIICGGVAGSAIVFFKLFGRYKEF
jgi:hypothetical protein